MGRIMTVGRRALSLRKSYLPSSGSVAPVSQKEPVVGLVQGRLVVLESAAYNLKGSLSFGMTPTEGW